MGQERIDTERAVVYNTFRTMDNDEKILKALEGLQADITTMKGDVGKIPAIEKQLEQQGKDITALKGDITALKNGQEQLEVKVEAIHDYQQKAHTEIMGHLVESNEMNGQEKKELEKRIERVEKHVGLPPPK
jgi:chromosome segregation ATPase